MRHFHLTRQKYFCPAVNIDKLWSLLSEQARDLYLNKKDKKDIAPVIDCLRAVSTQVTKQLLTYLNWAQLSPPAEEDVILLMLASLWALAYTIQ